MTYDDVAELVDEITDDLDPERLRREADRLNISVDALLGRVAEEVKARLA